MCKSRGRWVEQISQVATQRCTHMQQLHTSFMLAVLHTLMFSFASSRVPPAQWVQKSAVQCEPRGRPLREQHFPTGGNAARAGGRFIIIGRQIFVSIASAARETTRGRTGWVQRARRRRRAPRSRHVPPMRSSPLVVPARAFLAISSLRSRHVPMRSSPLFVLARAFLAIGRPCGKQVTTVETVFMEPLAKFVPSPLESYCRSFQWTELGNIVER